MTTALQFQFHPYDSSRAPDVVNLWNRTIGEAFPFSEELLRQVTEQNPSFRPADAVTVWDGGELIGFGLMHRYRGTDEAYQTLADHAHITAIIVAPERQRQGIGTEIYLRLRSRIIDLPQERIRIGAGVSHLFPGPPEELPAARPFFESLDFTFDRRVCDVRVDLSNYQLPASASEALARHGLTIGPATAEEWDQLLDFLGTEFSANWRYGADRFLQMGGDPADWFLMRQGEEIVGFARMHHPGPPPIGAGRYWADLRGSHAGGLGPIGVAARLRGHGLGLALLHLTLDRLQTLGVTDAVADWTDLIDFYARVGMAPWKCYVMGR
jgi:GNAT superfamily N-acetyltransferase